VASPGARATSQVVGGVELLGMNCSLPTVDEPACLLVRSTATPRTRLRCALALSRIWKRPPGSYRRHMTPAGAQQQSPSPWRPRRCEESQSAAPQRPLSESPLAVPTSAPTHRPLYDPNRHAAVAVLTCVCGPSQRRRRTQIRTGSRCWSRAAAAARYGRPRRYARSHALLLRPT